MIHWPLIYLSCEDDMTHQVTVRLLDYCGVSYDEIKSIPARGGKIKSVIPQLNQLSTSAPVVLLTDLDASNCAPELKQNLLKGCTQNPQFIINIAVDEAEAWLMADRKGFSDFIGVHENVIPMSEKRKQGGSTPLVEMAFDYKSSLYLTHEIANQSSKNDVRQCVAANGDRCKGKEYNSVMTNFVGVWNIDDAMANSDSLSRMVRRIQELLC